MGFFPQQYVTPYKINLPRCLRFKANKSYRCNVVLNTSINKCMGGTFANYLFLFLARLLYYPNYKTQTLVCSKA